MRKGAKGFFGFAKEIVIFLLVSGLFVAFIAVHDWDIVKAIQWLLETTWDIIKSIADFLSRNEGFKKITK